MTPPAWWKKPRSISVVVDNPSWVLPYAKELVASANDGGDRARICRTHDEISGDGIAFYLGCINIAPPEVLAQNQSNLVVHASDLPRGRGFSPLTWQILARDNDIPICLLHAAEKTDAGSIVYRDVIVFEGHELIDEMREVMGRLTIDLCQRYLAEAEPPAGQPQSGETTYYSRRNAAASRLDPSRSIAEQFNLLRVVDNVLYPAYFNLAGHRYRLQITKVPIADKE